MTLTAPTLAQVTARRCLHDLGLPSLGLASALLEPHPPAGLRRQLSARLGLRLLLTALLDRRHPLLLLLFASRLKPHGLVVNVSIAVVEFV